ncbi:MAG: DUF1990 family protein [Planctomycetota bacterium]
MPTRVCLRRPTGAWLSALARSRAAAPVSGVPDHLDGPCPHGMARNAGDGRVGAWPDDFTAARNALRALRMFEVGWMAAAGDAEVGVGTNVAVTARVLGCWWGDVCRVTRVLDEPERAGFVYATLRGHRMLGAERFLVERRDDAVWFELRADARPDAPLARLGWPLVRAMQRRFARDAVAAMARAVRHLGARS